jgi:hypothetical protein
MRWFELNSHHGKDGIALLDTADEAMCCVKFGNDADYCLASREI